MPVRFKTPLGIRLKNAEVAKRYFARWKNDPAYLAYKRLVVKRWRAQRTVERLKRKLESAKRRLDDVDFEYCQARGRFRRRRAEVKRGINRI